MTANLIACVLLLTFPTIHWPPSGDKNSHTDSVRAISQRKKESDTSNAKALDFLPTYSRYFLIFFSFLC